MTSSRDGRIRRLIRLARDGVKQCRSAALRAGHPAIRESCLCLADARARLASTLSQQCPAAVQASTSDPIANPPVTTEVAVNRDDLCRFQHAEEQLLNAFEHLLLECDTPGLRSALKRYLPQAESCLQHLDRITSSRSP